MNKKSGQGNLGIILLFFAILVIFLLINVAHLSIHYSFLVAVASIIFIIAFVHTDFALVALIFSMLLSPEFSLGGVSGREVVVRGDDIFLLVVFFGWLAKMAVSKELGLLKVTPLNKPIALYMAVCLIATLFGLLGGQVKLRTSIFYLLKYFEYFLVFFMVANSIKNYQQIARFVFSMVFVCLIISLYAWWLHFSGVGRVTAPFEGKVGEANTLGGYLLLMIMVIAGLFLNARGLRVRLFLGACLFFAGPALLFTQSRGAWLGFIPAFATLVILTRRGKVMLVYATVLVVVFASTVFPAFVQKRVSYTFSEGKHYRLMGKEVALEESAAARIENWRTALRYWVRSPLLGYGVGSPGPAIDNQYARFLLEVGGLGFVMFLLLMLMLLRTSILTLRQFSRHEYIAGLVAGFIAGLVGMLTHALTADTFIIIRIMEPFWFLAAIVVVFHTLTESSTEVPPQTPHA